MGELERERESSTRNEVSGGVRGEVGEYVMINNIPRDWND